VFKSYFIEAAEAAELAVNLINGKDVGKTTDFEGVKSFIFKPVVVNQDNVQETIVESGLYSADDICTKAYADACEKAGVS
jgi:D-xylose transport system substrate-binding protein